MLGPIAAAFVHLLLSQKREYEADRFAAEICDSPHGLADALVRLEAAMQLVGFEASPATEPVYTTNPFAEEGLAALFNSHPPVGERVRRLRELDPDWREKLRRSLSSPGRCRRPLGRRIRERPVRRRASDARSSPSIATAVRRYRPADDVGLYIGCGNGRNYVPLVEAGLDLVGLDVSATAIRRSQSATGSRSRLVAATSRCRPDRHSAP